MLAAFRRFLCLPFSVVPRCLTSQEEPHVLAACVQWQLHISAANQGASDSTAFFFIDPFGTKGAEIEPLARIASRPGKSETLVRYDDTRVKRLISWAANNLEHLDEAQRKAAQQLKRRVDQLTDEEAASQAELELLFGSAVETRNWLIQGYEKQVKAKTKFRYSLSYPIRNPSTGGHRYFLVHFCSHPDGYIYMANFMAQAERTYRQLSAGVGDGAWPRAGVATSGWLKAVAKREFSASAARPRCGQGSAAVAANTILSRKMINRFIG